MLLRRTFLGAACACAAAPLALAQEAPPGGKFICPPCGCPNDGKDFDKPGVCPEPACGMQLVPKPAAPAWPPPA